MAVITTPIKTAVSLKLNNGTTESGTVKTLNVSLGTLNLSAFDASKVFAIAALLEPCLDRAIHRIEKTDTSRIEDE